MKEIAIVQNVASATKPKSVIIAMAPATTFTDVNVNTAKEAASYRNVNLRGKTKVLPFCPICGKI